MNTQHTPGPWGLAADDSVRSAGTKENGYLSHHICSLDHYRDDRVEQRVPNARLIAAAPELLAALNAMLTHMGMDEDEFTKPTFDQARAAIAQATGEAAPAQDHVTDGSPCWCNPEMDYKDPDTGAEVWVHKNSKGGAA